MVLVGSAALIDAARKWRKMLGGGLHQAGNRRDGGAVRLDTSHRPSRPSQNAHECQSVRLTARWLLLEVLVIEADTHLSACRATLTKHKPHKSLLLSVRTTM